MTRALLLLLLLLLFSLSTTTSFAATATFNPLHAFNCSYPFNCSFNDPALWIISATTFSDDNNTTYVIENIMDTQLIFNLEEEISAFRLQVRGFTLIHVANTLKILDTISMYDTSIIQVSGRTSFVDALNLMLYNSSSLIVDGGSVQLKNISGNPLSSVTMIDGILFMERMNVGYLQANQSAQIPNITATPTPLIFVDSLQLDGAAKITANIVVRSHATLSGDYTLSGLLVRGNGTININSHCPNIHTLATADYAQVLISAPNDCSLQSLSVNNKSQLVLIGEHNWNISKAVIRNGGYLGFHQLHSPQTSSVSILDGQGSLDFRGAYSVYLGQNIQYYPDIPDAFFGKFILDHITYSKGPIQLISNGVILNEPFSQCNMSVTVPAGKSLAVTKDLNINEPNLIWEPNASLIIRGNATLYGNNTTLQVPNNRSIVFQTASTLPGIVVDSLVVTNATLRSEHNGAVQGYVLIDSKGHLDLSQTLTLGFFYIDGSLTLLPGSNLSILIYFTQKRVMFLKVNGDVYLSGHLAISIGGARPSNYNALGIEVAVMNCTGLLNGDFESFSYSLSTQLAANASSYIVSYRKQGNTLFVKMSPLPRAAPPVPPEREPSNLSHGAIAGIVIGGVVLFAIVVGFLINGWCSSKKPKKVKVYREEELSSSSSMSPSEDSK